MWPKTVRKSDLRITYYRGSGPGGQHKNKRDTACRIVHIPTGVSCTAQENKSQSHNREAAFKRLASKLVPLMTKTEEVQRSTKTIRTYHEPRQQVKDKRVPGVEWNYSAVMTGKALSDIIAKVQYNEERQA